MPGTAESQFQGAELRGVRPYLVVSDATTAIDFYRTVFDAEELERHTTPTGGVGHAKFRIGDAVIELGEHASAAGRAAEQLPRVGLRVYVADVDATFDRAVAAGADGDAPSDRPEQGVRGATVYDPFGLTWWMAASLD